MTFLCAVLFETLLAQEPQRDERPVQQQRVHRSVPDGGQPDGLPGPDGDARVREALDHVGGAAPEAGHTHRQRQVRTGLPRLPGGHDGEHGLQENTTPISAA